MVLKDCKKEVDVKIVTRLRLNKLIHYQGFLEFSQLINFSHPDRRTFLEPLPGPGSPDSCRQFVYSAAEWLKYSGIIML